MREAYLEKYRILVVRFTNKEIEQNLIGVMNELEEIIHKRKIDFDRTFKQN
jgi:very-short-patch-repair endonuclease